MLKNPKGTHGNIERVNPHVYALWTCCVTMETNTPALEEAKCIHQNSLIQSHNEYVKMTYSMECVRITTVTVIIICIYTDQC